MRSTRRHQKPIVRGGAFPCRCDATNGRYNRKPDMRKNTATPTSARAKYRPHELRTSKPVSKATCVSSTLTAAMARKPSNNGNRVARRSGAARSGASLRTISAIEWSSYAWSPPTLPHRVDDEPDPHLARRHPRRRRRGAHRMVALRGEAAVAVAARPELLPALRRTDRPWPRLRRPLRSRADGVLPRGLPDRAGHRERLPAPHLRR